MKHDMSVYSLTEAEQQDLIKRLSQDVSFMDDDYVIEQDELFDSERDYSNTEPDEVF
jgi:hypothetical protein